MSKDALFYYNTAIKTYPAPDTDLIDWAKHFFMPVDCVLKGLDNELRTHPSSEELSALKQKCQEILDQINELTENEYQRDYPGIESLLRQVDALRGIASSRQVLLAANANPVSQKNNNANEVKSKKTKMAVGVILLAGLGIFIGSMLVSTGIFAPFGLGILAMAMLGAIGGGIGLVIGLGIAGIVYLASRDKEESPVKHSYDRMQSELNDGEALRLDEVEVVKEDSHLNESAFDEEPDEESSLNNNKFEEESENNSEAEINANEEELLNEFDVSSVYKK